MTSLIDTVLGFLEDRSGAVAVEWVVLTAGIIGFVAVFMLAMSDNVGSAAGRIETDLDKTSSMIETLP